MLKQRIIVLLALCCIVVSVPVSFLANIFAMLFYVNPSAVIWANLVKSLPAMAFAVVLIYGVICIANLANNNKPKDAARLTIILMVLFFVAIFVIPLFSGIGIRYVL